MPNLSLKWDKHPIVLNKTLKKIYSEEKYSDCTLVCDDKFYHVHKVILSMCSTYFERIFEEYAKIEKHPFIIIRDVHYKIMDNLLNYMYKGELTVPEEDIPKLIQVAETFKVQGLIIEDKENELPPNNYEQNQPNSNSPPRKKRALDSSSCESNSSLERTLLLSKTNSDKASPSKSNVNMNKTNESVTSNAEIKEESIEKYADASDIIDIHNEDIEPYSFDLNDEINEDPFEGILNGEEEEEEEKPSQSKQIVLLSPVNKKQKYGCSYDECTYTSFNVCHLKRHLRTHDKTKGLFYYFTFI